MPEKAVIILPYHPAWPAAFTAAARNITTALADALRAIHHIGSTSVPNLPAKPIIDILVVTPDLAALDRRAPHMESLGYQVMGEFGIPGRRYFRRFNPAGDRTHHVHAFQAGSPHITRHLAFRDYLRAHPAAATEYGQLKQRLATAHPHDPEAYMDGKDPFIKQTEAQALQWAASKNG